MDLEKILRAILGRQIETREDFYVAGAGDETLEAIPDDAIIMRIENLGTHGAFDTVIINQLWPLAGGEAKEMNWCNTQEYDRTQWSIQWESTAIDKKVLFVYKIPVK